jgi:hypothetical protein
MILVFFLQGTFHLFATGTYKIIGKGPYYVLGKDPHRLRLNLKINGLCICNIWCVHDFFWNTSITLRITADGYL